MREYIWMGIRVVLLLGLILPRDAAVEQDITPSLFFFLAIPFSLIFALGVSAFVTAPGCRDKYYSLVDLFLFTPLWVFAGYYCSFWIFLGCLIAAGSASGVVQFWLMGQFLWLPWVGVMLGGVVMVSVLLTRHILIRREHAKVDGGLNK